MSLSTDARTRLGIATTDFSIGNEIADAVDTSSTSSHAAVTLAAVGSAPAAAGASLVGQVLTLQLADGSHPGLVTAAQFTKLSNTSGTNTGDQSATTVANTPAGGVAAVTVQGAINELDTEKAALTGATFTGTVTAPNMAAGEATVLTGQASIAVTDAGATATSKVVATLVGIDGTALYVTNIARGSGTFTVSVNAAATGDVKLTWIRFS